MNVRTPIRGLCFGFCAAGLGVADLFIDGSPVRIQIPL